MSKWLPVLVLLAGCATAPPPKPPPAPVVAAEPKPAPDLRRRYLAENPSLKPEFRTAILAHDIVIGMDWADVMAAYDLWGILKAGSKWEAYRAAEPKPDWSLWDSHRTETSTRIHEQWVLKRGFETRYLYFDNGILTAIQN